MKDNAKKLKFAADISPLFRASDIREMKLARRFDLSKYDDVSPRAARILERLEKGDMPCDNAWPPDRIQLFRQWIADGKLP
jgi:hypothetical protein